MIRNVEKMDQAHKLRELALNAGSEMDMISFVSGKGGVGKTRLVMEMQKSFPNTIIVDSDIASPCLWYLGKNVNYVLGYDTVNSKKYANNVITETRMKKYNSAFVDAGTGLNEVNRYYLEKSKMIVFVTDLQEVSILNTITLIKQFKQKKVVFINMANETEKMDIQERLNNYADTYLRQENIEVFNDMKALGNHISGKVLKKTSRQDDR